ncbi:ABC transporter permease [Gemella haemolysans]|uniref:ABC transporter permease n=1 Tax=Gemella haemolysans TaxID=1379 RepID=A0AAW6B6S2_9BACL|nr:ABC transporter permease [Gemella haemolysans]MDB6186162.1 ABC transporter permease [Gemella haemolysans]MDB6213166.1 ABC transporter permease [Gemella haemolysans]MDU4714287.1 ABC transporter permease [Gemella haemolysans]
MSFFYSKFALNNLVKNKRFIVPYVLSTIFTIMSFYILSSLAFGDNLNKLPNGIDATKQVLSLGIIVIAIFSTIFLFYTYSFLVKRRVKEFGLYSVLGMTKKQIAKILVLETIFIAVTTIVLGIGLGIIFDKLMLLVLLKLFSATVTFGFSITPIAVVFSVLLFGGIFFLLLLYTVIKIARLRIVALLKDENKGEKEPKSRWILAIIGLALIGYGYYTAQTVQNPVKALLVFFYAVVAVIIGTYLVFMAVSITVLKIMKNNKNFYYKPKNFISVSGLLYRMKRNAVGLANICILSTMVLVTMGSTSALYAGMEKSYNERFPRQLMVAGYNSTNEKLKEIENNAKLSAKEAGTEVQDLVSYNSLPMVGRLVEDKFNFESNVGVDLSNVKMIVVLQLKDYNKFANKNKTLESNEILLHIDKKGNYNHNSISLNGSDYKIKEKLSEFPGTIGSDTANIMDTYYAVVKDEKEITKLATKLTELSSKELEKRGISIQTGTPTLQNYVAFNIKDTTKEAKVIESFKKLEKQSGIEIEGKEENKLTFRGVFASFLFIGVFISFIFVISQVVIMYYKQISEGYEDKGNFEIMRKVGITDKQIKQSIRSQVLLIFFSPLIIATLHTIVAYPFIEKILRLFLITDNSIFLQALAVTIVVFAIFYLIVYAITSKIYYRIIKE